MECILGSCLPQNFQKLRDRPSLPESWGGRVPQGGCAYASIPSLFYTRHKTCRQWNQYTVQKFELIYHKKIFKMFPNYFFHRPLQLLLGIDLKQVLASFTILHLD